METKIPGVISIASFGAIRPLKNQLIQAMAGIAFANEMGKTLHFHINRSRLEQNGENVYKNLKALFHKTNHKLIEHEWLLHDDFINIVRTMDLGLQVSFSETFNIVAADFVHNNIPIVVSKEISWINCLYKADPTDIDSIISRLWLANWGKKYGLQKLNRRRLKNYNKRSLKIWKKLIFNDQKKSSSVSGLGK